MRFIEDRKNESRDVFVSFVIPHRGREGLLQQTLYSISRQREISCGVEVIIVTQNSALSISFKEYSFPVRVLYRSPRCTISHLRNQGVREAQGTYIALLDADVSLSPHWLKTMIKEIQERDCVMVCAPQNLSPGGSFIEEIRVALSKERRGRYIAATGGWNMFLTKEDFWACGGFPEEIFTCEDYYFCEQLREQGNLFCSANAYFFHLGEDRSLKELFKKEIWRSRGNIHSLRGRSISPKEIPSILIPFWIAIFLLTAFLFLIKGKLFLFIGGVSLALLPVVIYALRGKVISNSLSIKDLLFFYFFYFLGRTIGTLWGMGEMLLPRKRRR